MKYIKMFEDINVDGYEEVTAGYIADNVVHNKSELSEFSDREIRLLTGLKDKYGENINLEYANRYDDRGKVIGKNLSTLFNQRINIFCVKDQWYFVSYLYKYRSNGVTAVYKYYKCDQMDGLMNCLNVECCVSIDESLFENNYYIGQSELFDDLSSDLTDYAEFTPKELNILRNMWFEDTRESDRDSLLASQLSIFNKQLYYEGISLHKMNDEWYYVDDEIKFYKCDQWDGLLLCLKNEFNIY